MNKELNLISKELYHYENRLNSSFTAMYENEEWKDLPVHNINILFIKENQIKRNIKEIKQLLYKFWIIKNYS